MAPHLRYFVIAFQILLSLHLICFSLPKRSMFPFRITIACIAYLGIYTAFPLPDVAFSVGMIALRSLYFMGMFFLAAGTAYACYNVNIRTSLFLSVIAYSLQHGVYLIFSIIDQFFLDFVTLPAVLDQVYVRRSFFTALIVPIAIFFGSRIKKHPALIVPSNFVLFVSLGVILGEIFFSQWASPEYLTKPLALNPAFMAFKAFNLIITILLLALILSRLERSSIERENALIKKMNREQAKLHMVNKETIDLINLKAHDLKHQIHRIQGREKDLSFDEIKDIENVLSAYDTVFETGNSALDTILQEKSLVCKSKGIALECIVDAKALKNMKETHIYSLFGNLLDNAIEASEKCEGPYIALKVKAMNNIAIIQEENGYVGKLLTEGGNIKTSKGDELYHGFGLKSIRYIVDKYSGMMTINADNQVFSLTITFEIES